MYHSHTKMSESSLISIQNMKMYAPSSLGNNMACFNVPHPSISFPAISGRQLRMKPIRASVSPPNNYSNGVSQPRFEAIERRIRWHEIEQNVRDYELDKFGLVNAAVYSSYCQLGHYELMKRIGITGDSLGAGEALGLIDLTMKFHSYLKSGDRFVLKVRISRSSAVRYFFEHVILKLPNKQPIMEANTVTVWLDKNYRPIQPPPEC